jgi:Ca2+-binding RTX toxin-like protein
MGTKDTNVWNNGTNAILYTYDNEIWTILNNVFVGSSIDAVRSFHHNSTLHNDGRIFSGGGYGVFFDGLYQKILNSAGAKIIGLSGIYVNGFGSDIQNHGEVSGLQNFGIRFAGSSYASLSNFGEIFGGFTGVFAASKSGGSINNSGRISSDQLGIEVDTDPGMTTTVRNAAGATIEGEYYAIYVGNGQILLDNRGTINGNIYCWAPDGNDTIINRGVITGHVELGGGNNVYDGRLGMLNGVLIGGNGIDRLFGGVANDTMYSAGGNDILIGGAGADALDGGAGFDYASYIYATAGVTARFDRPDINTGEAAGDSYNGVEGLVGSNYNDTLVGDGAANTLQGQAGNDTLYGQAGNDKLYGQAGNDKLYGQAGDDKLYGQAGNDLLIGGAGNDVLTGAAGLDTFFFNAALSATTNVDRITDFTVVDDTIRLENAIFTTLATGTLAAGAFRANTTGLAQDADDRVIYETDTGKLFYDSNGSAAGGSVHFATLGTGLALTNADFFVI